MEEMQQTDDGSNAGSSAITRLYLMALLLHIERAFALKRVTPETSGQRIAAPWHSGFAPVGSTQATNAAILERACRYIEDHLHEPLSAAQIADRSYVSVSHLNRLFRAQLNTSIMKFVTQRRVQAAQSLLFHTHLPVSAIATLIGYAHVAQFSMVFKRISGFSPLQYRQQKRLENHSAG